MSEEINQRLSVHMGELDTARPYMQDISEALRVADKLQLHGYSFSLRDLCPSKMDESMWSARFIDAQGQEYEMSHSQASNAICLAALKIFDS
ncbi:MAG TPA: hypothetical protein VJ934_00355 [Desulfomicrobiaceae bacterium]|nr:hypothetical protein [Desulfomicrobiaceae bacterium]